MSASSTPAPRNTLLTLWLIALGGLFVLFFGPTFQKLIPLWKDNYSHGYFVLPISAYLAWEWCSKHRVGQGETAVGLFFIILGLFLHLVGFVLYLWPMPFLPQYLGMVAVLWGIAVIIGGQQWAIGLRFPILFLFFMFPIGEQLLQFVSLWLQEQVTNYSAGILDSLIICQREGTSLHLPGVEKPLVVAEECSGLRQLITFAAMGACVGFWRGRNLWTSGILFVLAIPVAIIVNTLRVVLMGLGAYYYGVSWLDGWLHHAPALLTFPLGFVLFLAAAWLLKPIASAPVEEETAP